MYVCLCLGVTNATVSDTVARGARTTAEVAEACGAGSECGRCRRTVRALLQSSTATADIAKGPRR
jgi:bacterioferritin-associated ferredoxin